MKIFILLFIYVCKKYIINGDIILVKSIKYRIVFLFYFFKLVIFLMGFFFILFIFCNKVNKKL